MGGATLPPGFRFHPTDEELVGYYLKRKVEGLEIELEVIPVVDLYKFDPWELPEKSFLPKRDMEWFFFCPRDRKYPNGSRTNRATSAGYWKATGKDRKVVCQSASATGYRKTLVFYRGRAPLGDRTDWVMHEYRLCDGMIDGSPNFQGGFALCRIIKRNESGSKTTLSSGETSKTKRVGSSSSFVDLTSTRPSEVDPFNNNIVSSGDISSQTSWQYNEGSRFSSPVNSSPNCNYAVGKMPEFEPAPLQANSADFWVSQDLILDSSKDYQQLHQPAASQFSQSHELQASMNQRQPYNNNHREFSPTSSYSNLTGEFEFSRDLTRIGCTSPYENYAGFEENNQYVSFEGYDQTNSLYYNDNLF